jgi:hypothetical protein
MPEQAQIGKARDDIKSAIHILSELEPADATEALNALEHLRTALELVGNVILAERARDMHQVALDVALED